MPIKLCMIMDPILHIKVHKDTSFAILLEAQRRQWEIYYLRSHDLVLEEQQVFAYVQHIHVKDQPENFVEFVDTSPQKRRITDFDIVFMRQDPPFNDAYLYATYLLEMAQRAGVVVVNDPKGIRNANEKLFSLWFKHCPKTLVTSKAELLRDFLNTQGKIVVKPLNSMGGQGVFLLSQGDLNVNSVIDYLTNRGNTLIVAQRYIPDIFNGDKRILMIEGEPYPYALSRIPPVLDFRGNLAAGAKGVGSMLTDNDRKICEEVGPVLKQQGLFFVGLDVIGEYLTEINVTSPTCVREIEAAFGVNVCKEILDRLEAVMPAKAGIQDVS